MEYGAAYHSVRDPRHAERDLDRLRDEGLNAILHTFDERDQSYYAGTVEEIVAASRERDFTVYVGSWGMGRVFAGLGTDFLVDNPETKQVLSTGKRVPAACPNHPDFRAFMREWIEDATTLGSDAIFWDEPRWYVPEDDDPAGA